MLYISYIWYIFTYNLKHKAMITFEKDTKETRIADLNRRLKFNHISDTLFDRAMKSLKLGKSIIYYVDGNTGKVKNIKVKK